MKACASLTLGFPILLLSVAGAPVWAASNVTVTPSSVGADYRGDVVVEATVGSGDRIVLSLGPDFNGNGVMDGLDRAVWVYVFRDGVPNPLDHPGRVVDRDGAQNGHIRAVVPFFDAPHMVGNYVVTVVDQTSAARATFAVTAPAAWSQKITGTVAKDAVSHAAMVLALLPLGESEIQFGAFTDENGDFELPVGVAGQYFVGAFYLDTLTDFEGGSAAPVNLAADETFALPSPLLLFDGDYTVSGQVVRVDGPGTGVPLLFLLLEGQTGGGDDFVAPGVTDASGYFSLPAKAGTVEIEANLLNPRGLVVRPEGITVVDADVSDVTVSAYGIQGVITGTVTNQHPAIDLHVGLDLSADRSTENFEVWDAYTNANGDYWIGVTAGDWWVRVHSAVLTLSGYIVQPPGSRYVSVGSGQTVENVDFVIGRGEQPLIADINGDYIVDQRDLLILLNQWSGRQ